MDKRFKLQTLILGVLTGASTLAMIIQNKPETNISGSIAIITFIISVIMDVRDK